MTDPAQAFLNHGNVDHRRNDQLHPESRPPRALPIRNLGSSAGWEIDVESFATIAGSSTNTKSTGTVSNLLAPAFALGYCGANGTMSTVTAITNGFQVAQTVAAATPFYMRSAMKPINTPGSVESTMTWTTARSRGIARMIVLSRSVASDFVPQVSMMW